MAEPSGVSGSQPKVTYSTDDQGCSVKSVDGQPTERTCDAPIVEIQTQKGPTVTINATSTEHLGVRSYAHGPSYGISISGSFPIRRPPISMGMSPSLGRGSSQVPTQEAPVSKAEEENK